ncbi:hypothetical protein [Hydrogenophilus thermoluteolus]|uniref:hypothetical protein n=1 Tax=Hydrogenophilus thermoluteolus TaxID=297 RepID=UPI003F66B8A5
MPPPAPPDLTRWRAGSWRRPKRRPFATSQRAQPLIEIEVKIFLPLLELFQAVAQLFDRPLQSG